MLAAVLPASPTPLPTTHTRNTPLPQPLLTPLLSFLSPPLLLLQEEKEEKKPAAKKQKAADGSAVDVSAANGSRTIFMKNLAWAADEVGSSAGLGWVQHRAVLLWEQQKAAAGCAVSSSGLCLQVLAGSAGAVRGWEPRLALPFSPTPPSPASTPPPASLTPAGRDPRVLCRVRPPGRGARRVRPRHRPRPRLCPHPV